MSYDAHAGSVFLVDPQFLLCAFHAAFWHVWLQYLALPHLVHFLNGPLALPQLSQHSEPAAEFSVGPAAIAEALLESGVVTWSRRGSVIDLYCLNRDNEVST